MPPRFICMASRRTAPWTAHARRWREFFNCHDAEVVFNSGGTEGDNTAIFGLLRPGDHFITTSIEHSAVLQAAERVAERGVEVTFVAPQPSGLIDPADIERAIRPETRLISVMLANNETGVLQPVEEIGKIAAAARRLLPYRRGAGRGQGGVRRAALWLPSAFDQRAQDARAQGRGRDVCAPRNTRSSRCWWAAATSAAGAPEPRMCRALWAWARPRSWPWSRSKTGRSTGWRHCATDWRQAILQIPGTGVNGAWDGDASSARGQHDQHLVRSGGGRGAGDCARPEGRRR